VGQDEDLQRIVFLCDEINREGLSSEMIGSIERDLRIGLSALRKLAFMIEQESDLSEAVSKAERQIFDLVEASEEARFIARDLEREMFGDEDSGEDS
jgi:hypothetical protein